MSTLASAQAGTGLGDESQLSVAIEPLLQVGQGSVRSVFDRVAAMRFRGVQLSATVAGLRPRDLDRSARRDILATLRRAELSISGLDAWIPPHHFLDQAHVDRAITSLGQIIELAADLGRCPVCFALPAAEGDQLGFVVEALAAVADRCGVMLADHAVPIAAGSRPAMLGIGIDPAAWLSHKLDPVATIHTNSDRVYSARLSDLTHTGMRSPIGASDGRLDVLAYKIALSLAGFQRPVVIDARQWQAPWEGLQQSRTAWLQSLPNNVV